MIKITLITVGKLKEKFFIEASREYEKRLSAYANFKNFEVDQVTLPSSPSPAQIEAALTLEGDKIEKHIPKSAFVIPLCIEGKELSSEELSEKLEGLAMTSGDICFIIGGSFGLSDKIKQRAGLRLSMSKMTFPHRLARIMLLEQIYRAFKISEGSPYHK